MDRKTGNTEGFFLAEDREPTTDDQI